MLLHNTTLQHLFLNPVRLDKQEAIAIIENCIDNATLELLSLVQWPLKKLSGYPSHAKKNPFIFSAAQEIKQVLLKI